MSTPKTHTISKQELQSTSHQKAISFSEREQEVYRKAVSALTRSSLPFALGGAIALNAYTGLWRGTKDIDIFISHRDVEQATKALEEAGFTIKVEFTHWLIKAYIDDLFIDLIFGNDNGELVVEREHVQGGRCIDFLGHKVNILPPEEIIASKCFVAVRHRFDGHDIAHIILALQGNIDWNKVVERLGRHRTLLLWHLILFSYVYPGYRHLIPKDIMWSLIQELFETQGESKACNGVFIDPFSYNVDVESWGFIDCRKIKIARNV